MPVIEKLLIGSGTTLISTPLFSTPSNGLAFPSGVFFDNTVGGSGDGYTMCDVELVVTYGVAPTANTGVSVWFLQTQDGSNFEDGDASTTPARMPDLVFPLRAVTTQQRVIRRVLLPWGVWRPLAKNDGTGQTTASSGNSIKIRPVTRQLV